MAAAPEEDPLCAEEREDDDDEEEEDDGPVAPKFQPAEAVYRVPRAQRFNRRSTPYKESTTGLGIYMAEGLQEHMVYARENGDSFKFGEPNNAYGLKVTILVAVRVRELRDNFVARDGHEPEKADEDDDKDGDVQVPRVVVVCNGARRNVINRVSEQGAFDAVYKEQVVVLARSMDTTPDEVQQRQLKAVWKIWSAFNSAGPNAELGTVLLFYAKIRVAEMPFVGDELQAAIAAVKLYFVSVTSEYSATPAKQRQHERRALNDFSSGSWTLPVVLALNDHMIDLGMSAISFSCDANQFDAAREDRKLHSRTIWLGGREVKVESRNKIIRELQAYAGAHHGHVLPDVPPCEGRPADGEGEPAPRRGRHSLGY
jgi:hypothetical protein